MARTSAKCPGRTRLYVLLGVMVVLGGVYVPLHQRRMDDALVLALVQGEEDAARGALRWGADPNARLLGVKSDQESLTFWQAWLRFFTGRHRTRQRRGTPALILAARGPHATVLKDLLARGADPNASTANGRTALHVAAQSAASEGVRALLAAGANVRARDRDGTSPILQAARIGNPSVLGALLDRGADLEDKDPEQRTPVMLAAQAGHDKAVRFLLSRGADPTAPRRIGVQPLVWASGAGSVPMLEALWRRGPRTVEGTYALALALEQAVKGAHIAAARYLLDRGAAANGIAPPPAPEMAGPGTDPAWLVPDSAVVRASTGRAPPGRLSRPMHIGPGTLPSARIGAGAAVIWPGRAWPVRAAVDPPLLAACQAGDRAMVDLLLARGADVNRVGLGEMTPLMAAAASGRTAIAKLLLARGAKVEAHSMSLGTPLLAAARSGNEELVRLLIAHGANARTADRQGETPLHGAAATGRIAMLLLNHGADPNARNLSGATPLARAWSPEVATTLLARGADPNAADAQGVTPLMRAAETQNVAMAEVLIKHGAKVNAVDAQGMTALGHLAPHSSFVLTPGSPVTRLHDMLVRAGAKPTLAAASTKGPTTRWPTHRP